MLEELQKADFEPRLSQDFEAHVEGFGPVVIELAGIEDRSTDIMESFSLLFRGDKERVFRQGTYKMTHPAMGEFILFLGPVITQKGDEGDRVYYEAVFNRLKSR
ncbi:MAG TPA: hypothetical protein VF799_12760 [Geobacteraceae bacterium]